ncbi:MAG: hypothetical protein ACRD26_16775 [Vicinamibacterales bacterium]
MSVRLVLALALALGVAGCRQADGSTPLPTGDQANEVGDIARDMVNIVNKDPQAPEDLRSDLAKYGSNAEAVTAINELSRQVAQGLADARLDDQTAERLAHTLWVAVTAKELSARQVDALEREVKAVLASAGVPEDRAQPIADRLGEVQQTITENRRRWYQFF